MEKRYFSTVIAYGKGQLRRLREFDLDIFHATVHASTTSAAEMFVTAAFAAERPQQPPETYEVEGLFSLEEIGQLVDEGYAVLVSASQDMRSRAGNVMEFEAWLKSMGEG
jgi:hypothetical protein